MEDKLDLWVYITHHTHTQNTHTRNTPEKHTSQTHTKKTHSTTTKNTHKVHTHHPENITEELSVVGLCQLTDISSIFRINEAPLQFTRDMISDCRHKPKQYDGGG